MHSLKAEQLRQFTGSEQFFRHAVNRNVVYTEGAQFLAEQGGAYWLLDEIAIAQSFSKRLAAEPFQVWTLRRDQVGNTATLIADDGNENTLIRKRIEFTDFPLPSVRLYFSNNTIYLPSEH